MSACAKSVSVGGGSRLAQALGAMSTRAQLAAIVIVLVLSVASFAVARFYSPSLGFKLGIPALVVAGLWFLGHLVTVDDDAPGGFSNSESSSPVWHSCLLELLAKAGLFVLVSILVMSGQ